MVSVKIKYERYSNITVSVKIKYEKYSNVMVSKNLNVYLFI